MNRTESDESHDASELALRQFAEWCDLNGLNLNAVSHTLGFNMVDSRVTLEVKIHEKTKSISTSFVTFTDAATWCKNNIRACAVNADFNEFWH
jgi:hypothetical protein